MEPRVEHPELLAAKLPTGSLIAIKVHSNLPSFASELKRAEFEGTAAQAALKRLEDLQSGKIQPEDDQDHYITNLDLTEADVQEILDKKSLERKKEKLRWLNVESSLVDLDTSIKEALGLYNADPEKALEYLKTMLKLDVKPLMLKKHPNIVDMVKRLRKYVGNLKDWNLSEEETEKFNGNAERVRKMAEEVYHKFREAFKVDGERSFWDCFSGYVKAFKEAVTDLSEGQVFVLCAEPGMQFASGVF